MDISFGILQLFENLPQADVLCRDGKTQIPTMEQRMVKLMEPTKMAELNTLIKEKTLLALFLCGNTFDFLLKPKEMLY